MADPVRANEMVLVEQSAVLFARRAGPTRKRHAYELRTALRMKHRRAGWTPFDIGFVVALFVLFVLNMMDITITLIHIGNAGWIAEGNPLIRNMAERGTDLAPVVFKIVVISGASAIMWRLYRQTTVAMWTARTSVDRRRAQFVFRSQLIATGILLALYTWIIQNNVRITWL